ncbi:oligopeptide transport system ATP-binding protein [Amphibacillus marinus]|uniref:Oligopeptide transport system ATP-binding protein n=1 Tax=Amphibacillus marinus TaxID=872970 RepID=A0A1H8S7I1_9BACI|nr:ATP-binding cassette domain-containing protein [Amphibacillus marinus]SEO74354.1 oligopeptide transport system ATP-binding protein [Amphibacillus marinus]
MNKNPIMQIKNLKKTYNTGKANEVRAVDNISFDIYEGETFGLVGESGSGKSTTGKLLMKLESMTDGQVIFLGESIQNKRSRHDLLAFRKNIQMIFQDPYASLNPKMTVKDIIGGPLEVHRLVSSRKERDQVVYSLLEQVGLSQSFANRYPKEFSGGQCQRIGIARALALQPKFIIADEAISALDVSIQAQIVNLMRQLKQEANLTYLFIAHDLSMVKYISDRIAVMNRGKILELATSDDIYHVPLHPYTASLLSAIPEPDPESERNRQRTTYDESKFTYEQDDPAVGLFEITDKHFVYCHKDEVVGYKEKAERLKQEIMI